MSERVSRDEALDYPREACGVAGIIRYEPTENLAAQTTAILSAEQNRGEDGAGVFINNENESTRFGYPYVGTKEHGLVSSALAQSKHLHDMVGPARISIGHTRYGTSHGAGDDYDKLQPLPGGSFMLAHNGHIPNMTTVAARYGISPDSYSTDSGGLTATLGVVAEEHGLDMALHEVLPQLYGAYSLVIAADERLLGIRDPWGMRPLALGEVAGIQGYAFASESAALSAANATYVRDVDPGEIVSITTDGKLESSLINLQVPRQSCALEMVYIARPDSLVPGTELGRPVSHALLRQRMGEQLAREHPVDADLVLGVPDSGMAVAIGYAMTSGITLMQHGLTRNPYAARSFIQPHQMAREQTTNAKLRVDKTIVAGKRIVVVEDSVVRGTTMRTLVDKFWEADAQEVHLRIAYPPVRHPCYFGVDIGTSTELLAHDKDIDTMRRLLNADSLSFISESGLKQAIGLPLGSLCMACTNGIYPPHPAMR